MNSGRDKTSILVIDDDLELANSISSVLKDKGYDVEVCTNGDDGLKLAKEKPFQLVLTDFRMPGVGGMEILESLQDAKPALPVIMMTGFGNVDTAIGATKRGAYDYLVKPFKMDDLLRIVRRGVEAGETHIDVRESDAPDGTRAARTLVGKSKAMQNVYKEIGRLAPTRISVLICGETGVGKELVAKAIHEHSERGDGPFVAVNCGAIPENLIESELFGFEKGAFTGADAAHKGYFEQAEGGTLFLDEIGDLPLNMQVKLLRILQEKHIRRLGSDKESPLDVRILAATHQEMEDLIREQQFREDLFYRLNTVILNIPPLRDRRDDIPLLIECFIRRAEEDHGIKSGSFTEGAKQVMAEHDWPGNVRELESFVTRALLENSGYAVSDTYCRENIGSHSFPKATGSAALDSHLREEARSRIAAASASGNGDAYAEIVQQAEAVVIEEALKACDGNRTKAADLLGISRVTLRQKISRLGIS
ncbi:MAG: sigma-54 dependent transcriptional regulator [Verrucomicrobiota bacterium]